MTSESVWHIPFNVCMALKNGTKYKEKQRYNLDTRREGIPLQHFNPPVISNY